MIKRKSSRAIVIIALVCALLVSSALFTDVMQEKNGLFTEDRKPKADIAKLRLINGFK